MRLSQIVNLLGLDLRLPSPQNSEESICVLFWLPRSGPCNTNLKGIMEWLCFLLTFWSTGLGPMNFSLLFLGLLLWTTSAHSRVSEEQSDDELQGKWWKTLPSQLYDRKNAPDGALGNVTFCWNVMMPVLWYQHAETACVRYFEYRLRRSIKAESYYKFLN